MTSTTVRKYQSLLSSFRATPRGSLAPAELKPLHALLHRPFVRRMGACAANADADEAPLVTLDSIVPAVSYAAMIGYVVMLAPNQTPLRDQ